MGGRLFYFWIATSLVITQQVVWKGVIDTNG